MKHAISDYIHVKNLYEIAYKGSLYGDKSFISPQIRTTALEELDKIKKREEKNLETKAKRINKANNLSMSIACIGTALFIIIMFCRGSGTIYNFAVGISGVVMLIGIIANVIAIIQSNLWEKMLGRLNIDYRMIKRF